MKKVYMPEGVSSEELEKFTLEANLLDEIDTIERFKNSNGWLWCLDASNVIQMMTEDAVLLCVYFKFKEWEAKKNQRKEHENGTNSK